MYSVFLDSDVLIPMRDDIRLATDIYHPADSKGNRVDRAWPIILVRTSYNKNSSEWDDVPEWYTQRGYVYVIQDLRSRYGSEGDTRYYHCLLYTSDAADE